MDYFNAFWTGGLICALVQILLDKTKLLPGRVMVLLVCSGALLSFLGLYQPFVNFAGAGATVPLLGFGHTFRRWLSWIIYRWFYCLCPRGLCRFDLFISVQYDLPPANERLR